MIRRILLLVLAAAMLPAAAEAQPVSVKDPAELFPPDSLLYAEVVKPADISRAVGQFVKGSVVEDMTEFMSKWREKKGDGYFMESEIIATLSAFAGPEALAEYRRIQGAAFAITGLNKKNEPELAFVLLAGDSHIPNFIMRMYLTVDPMIRPAGKVEGVTMYWEKRRVFNRVGPGGAAPPPQPPESIRGPIFAAPPGAVIVGSSVETVGDIIKRMKGKEKRLSLLGAAGFQDAAAMRQRPGLFTFVNPGRVMEAFETAFKGNDGDFPPVARRAVAELLNPKGLRYAASSLTLTDGSFDLQVTVQTARDQTSPLLQLVADQQISLPALQSVPKDSIGLFTFALKDGEKQFQSLLALADKVIGDDGPRPGEQVKAIEQQLKASIGKDILGRIASVTLAMPAKQELPKGVKPAPMLVITGKDAAAAEQLEKLVPSILSLASGEPIEPITENIHGQKVRSVPGKSLPFKAALNYGRGGSSLIFGLDRNLVAASMAGARKDSLAGDARVMSALKPHEHSACVGMFRWGTLLPDWFSELGRERVWVNGKIQDPDKDKEREKAEKLRKSMATLIQELPPLVVSLSRKNDQFVFQLQQRQQAGASAKLIDGLLEAVMSSASDLFENAARAAPPLPPPPPIKN